MDADGLHIQGAGLDETVILGKDRYANILSFSGCQGLTIADLTAGHSPQPGFCAGGVVYLQNCGDVQVEGCGLFGCGTVGVWASGCRGLAVQNCRIYECSDSAVTVDSCRDVTVADCEIDHNSWRNEETIASSMFQACDGDGFLVSGCHIHDNTATTMFSSARLRPLRRPRHGGRLLLPSELYPQLVRRGVRRAHPLRPERRGGGPGA